MIPLLEATLPSVKEAVNIPGVPLLCLALHHFSMRLHVMVGKKTLKIALASSVDDLPAEFGDFGLSNRRDKEKE